jgi:hypothetical protein
MSDPTRARINVAFDEELGAAPIPGGLRALSVRAAVTAGRPRSPQPALLALVAAAVMLALVVTLVVGSNALRHNQAPSRSRPAPSVLPPSPRSGAAMVYDAAHGELVLFGGIAITGKVSNETWTWDGKRWRLYHLSVAPAPRQGAAMAYDAAHHDVVLFGGAVVEGGAVYVGKGSQSQSDDTWTWNGSAWKQLHPAHVPPINFGWPASMAYDPVSKAVLLFAFEQTPSANQTNMVAETWSWNGADWRRLTSASGPSLPGQMVTMERNVLLFAQARDRVGGRFVTQIWDWDGASWQQQPMANYLTQPLTSLAYDPVRVQYVMFDGDTWILESLGWKRVHARTEPSAAGYSAYFGALQEVVMWGDLAGNTSNDLWAWDGADWKQLAAGTMPPVSPPAGTFGPGTPAAAAAFIRQTVKAACPVLLPAALPAGMEASGVATADSFNVDYRTDQRDRTISLATVVANPPPGDDRSSDRHVAFRGGTGEYFVYDASAPQSDRWLMWFIGPPKTDGCPYFLSASGLTDSEFWQVANSLR